MVPQTQILFNKPGQRVDERRVTSADQLKRGQRSPVILGQWLEPKGTPTAYVVDPFGWHFHISSPHGSPDLSFLVSRRRKHRLELFHASFRNDYLRRSSGSSSFRVEEAHEPSPRLLKEAVSIIRPVFSRFSRFSHRIDGDNSKAEISVWSRRDLRAKFTDPPRNSRNDESSEN